MMPSIRYYGSHRQNKKQDLENAPEQRPKPAKVIINAIFGRQLKKHRPLENEAAHSASSQSA
jgi:hypothetical protein